MSKKLPAQPRHQPATRRWQFFISSFRRRVMKSTISSVFLTGLLTGCGQNTLTPLALAPNSQIVPSNFIEVSANFCTRPRQPVKSLTKYLFLIDQSLYNSTPINLPDNPVNTFPPDFAPADPQGFSRFGPLVEFTQAVQAMNNPSAITLWNAIGFNTFAAPKANSSGSDITGLFTNVNGNFTAACPNSLFLTPKDFLPCLQANWWGRSVPFGPVPPLPADEGWTDYIGALTTAQMLITRDLNSNTATPGTANLKPTYQVFFISGGMPFTLLNNPNTHFANGQPLSQITTAIQDLLQLPSQFAIPFQVNFHTAYYPPTGQVGQPIPQVIQLLKDMAQVSQGLFINLGAAQNNTYFPLTPTQFNLRSQLVDIFLENRNLVWWNDGRLLLDSDGDGLPDLLETPAGSNPNLPDSDGNGVSDYVEYRLNGKPCNDPQCAKNNANAFGVCSGLNPITSANGTTYPDSDNDGLNDCEETLLKANLNQFSTPANMIPDFLALKNWIPIQPSSLGAFAIPFSDLLTPYLKLKYDLPTSIDTSQSASSTTTYTRRSSELSLVSSPNVDQDCYQMLFHSVNTLNFPATLKIHLIENASLTQDTPVLRTAEKTLPSKNAQRLDFVPSDFN